MDGQRKNWFDKMVTVVGVLVILGIVVLAAVNIVRGIVTP